MKTVLLGITGCIAAYKACYIVRGLQKAGVRVKVVMTEHATHFVGPTTFRALTNEEVAVKLFDERLQALLAGARGRPLLHRAGHGQRLRQDRQRHGRRPAHHHRAGNAGTAGGGPRDERRHVGLAGHPGKHRCP